MPCLGKNTYLSLFQEMIRNDLNQMDWSKNYADNLSKNDRSALKDLHQAKGVVIKRSDKGGNVVLLSEDMYEAKRLLEDRDTYKLLEDNPFPLLVETLNEKLKLALELGLLTI